MSFCHFEQKVYAAERDTKANPGNNPKRRKRREEELSTKTGMDSFI